MMQKRKVGGFLRPNATGELNRRSNGQPCNDRE